MNLSKVTIGLGLSVLLQICVLVGMVVKAAMPLWAGTEIRVKTIPVDPRSMFRGNYARLNYEFGALLDSELPRNSNIRNGEIVYVSLSQGENGLYSFSSASFDEPSDGIFLRGRITNQFSLSVNYGIEAFFAPKEKALQLERSLINGGVAILMVTDSGRVALKDVVPNIPEN